MTWWRPYHPEHARGVFRFAPHTATGFDAHLYTPPAFAQSPSLSDYPLLLLAAPNASSVTAMDSSGSGGRVKDTSRMSICGHFLQWRPCSNASVSGFSISARCAIFYHVHSVKLSGPAHARRRILVAKCFHAHLCIYGPRLLVMMPLALTLLPVSSFFSGFEDISVRRNFHRELSPGRQDICKIEWMREVVVFPVTQKLERIITIPVSLCNSQSL